MPPPNPHISKHKSSQEVVVDRLISMTIVVVVVSALHLESSQHISMPTTSILHKNTFDLRIPLPLQTVVLELVLRMLL